MLRFPFYSKNNCDNKNKQNTEHQLQQHQRVSAYLFVHLLVICDVVFLHNTSLPCDTVCSQVFLCVPVHYLCILFGLCWKLFVNHMWSCVFDMASNFPVLIDSPTHTFSILYLRINLNRTIAIANNGHSSALLFIM